MTNQPNFRYMITIARMRHGFRCSVYLYIYLLKCDGLVEQYRDWTKAITKKLYFSKVICRRFSFASEGRFLHRNVVLVPLSTVYIVDFMVGLVMDVFASSIGEHPVKNVVLCMPA